MRLLSRFARRLNVRTYDIRERLRRDLILLVLVIVGSLIALTLLLGSQIRKNIATDQIERNTVNATRSLDQLMLPAERTIRILRGWGETGHLDIGNTAALTKRLIPTMEEMPQISGVILADSDGSEYLLIHEDEQWLTRTTTQSAAGDAQLHWVQWDGFGKMIRDWKDTSGYDPRTRPWYTGALNQLGDDDIFWTSPYIFEALQVPGATASFGWRANGDAEKVTVAGVDVLLSEIESFLSKLRIGDQGMAFLFDANGAVFIPDTDRDAASGPLPAKRTFFPVQRNSGGNEVFDAVGAWLDAGKPDNGSVRFGSGGERWWGRFVRLYADKNALWLAVVVPQSDLFGVIQRHWVLFALLVLVVLSAGIGLAMLFVSRYSRQLKDLPKTSIDRDDGEAEVYALIRSGESPTLEFKSTMRMNLKAGRPGKEIELAWLKTVVAFMNTEGGIVLLGVDDAGEILGMEVDGFENDDKCRLHFKNVVNQHVGLENSHYLRFEILNISGRKIAAVECERSREPVFLTAKNDESFYIRSGPSSVRLPVSKAFHYMQNHFH
ncbi:MAG: putative DNA binding domain-containing protein [Pseudomonadota bacterium]|nr:putative DNA binding domain-containing protein [Pseudomonadota bacterium]